jgi:hypothetical protein
MIDMFLAFGSNKQGNKIKYNYVFGESQPTISVIFLLTAFLCVPTMLMVKPQILKRRLAAYAIHGHAYHNGDEVHTAENHIEGGGKGSSFLSNEKAAA